jgi:hypothetical protein
MRAADSSDYPNYVKHQRVPIKKQRPQDFMKKRFKRTGISAFARN